MLSMGSRWVGHDFTTNNKSNNNMALQTFKEDEQVYGAEIGTCKHCLLPSTSLGSCGYQKSTRRTGLTDVEY
ncbi:50S ribosomal protein L32 [Varanus komodoensis]|nr:50S ribosomal protein L32 [Varanus komodoensis]